MFHNPHYCHEQQKLSMYHIGTPTGQSSVDTSFCYPGVDNLDREIRCQQMIKKIIIISAF